MPLVRYTLAAATAALLFGGVALAQPTAPSGSAPDTTASPPAADQPATPPPAATGQPAAPSGSMDNASAATGAAANTSADVPSGVQVIASQPVPDTPANRAKYGKPMSRAGKRTPAAGN